MGEGAGAAGAAACGPRFMRGACGPLSLSRAIGGPRKARDGGRGRRPPSPGWLVSVLVALGVARFLHEHGAAVIGAEDGDQAAVLHGELVGRGVPGRERPVLLPLEGAGEVAG